MKKNKINILVQGGAVQEIRADNVEDVDVTLIDLDNEPYRDEEWFKNTKEQHNIFFWTP